MKKEKVICKFCRKEEIVFSSRAKTYIYCSRQCMSRDYVKDKSLSIGDSINNWEVISDFPFRKYGRSYIKVRCTCGSKLEEDLVVRVAKEKKSKGCADCSRGSGYKGYRGLSGEYWSTIKHGAKLRNICFEITIEYAWDLFEKQKQKCKLSGLEIHFQKDASRSNRKRNFSRTASLDRIDSSKGYIVGNVQWVHKDINLMKNKFN